MEAKAVNCLDFLSKSGTQFIIPIYQRMYSWDREHCEKLWQDILQVGKNESTQAHFIGSVVYIHESTYHHSSIKQLLVIDGQQRLTTLTLLLEALCEAIDKEILEKFSKKKITNRYLINPDEENEKKYKLILTENDKDTLIALIDKDKAKPKEISTKIQDNFEFFKEKLEKNKDKLESICKGINKLLIIDVALERDKDDPQLIFESMNSTGKDLSQSDLIRNYILMDLNPKEQDNFYKNYWRVMELEFGENFNKDKKEKQSFDYFVKHYLTIKMEDIPNKDEIYETFKKYKQTQNINTRDLLLDLQRYAHFYCNMALKKEEDKELLREFENLSKLDTEVAYPFLLRLYDDYQKGILEKSDFIEILKIISSYIFRRMICRGYASNALNKVFAAAFKGIKEEDYLESVLAHFALLDSTSKFPTDKEFKEELLTRDLYTRFYAKRRYLLESLENFDRKEKVNINEFTIEHIMPQNIENVQEWQKELGENWQEIHEKYLNTLGNLTLSACNSEYSNKPFEFKQNCKKGFKSSPLYLNAGLQSLEKFDEESIKQRANSLANKALELWAYPKLPKETLEKYKTKKEKSGFTLDEHKFLQNSKNAELFEALRKEILALDEYVEEQILKLYIAYKFDTNFLAIIPLKKGLKLNINIYKHELDDPKNLARDVSNTGTWGNGKVEVVLENKEDLPYCLGLIRQALEKQQSL